MSLTNPNKVITEQRLSEFYQGIYPYLNGSTHAGFTPVGTIISVMGNSAPANYLACNGQIVNIVDYVELANYFTEQFGSANYFGGNGTTTFGIPDLRGEFLRGTGTNSHTDQGSGASVGTHQNATSHAAFSLHGSKMDFRSKTTTGGTLSYSNGDSIEKGNYYHKSISGTYGDPTADTEVTYTSRPTNTSVLYCIATKNIYVDARFDYSTDEKVVGTWIDGKPLYQKTITDTFGTITDGTVSSKSIEDLGSTVIINNIYGFCNGTTIGCWGASTQYFFRVCMQGTVLTAECNRGVMSNKMIKVTIQYTKTTD